MKIDDLYRVLARDADPLIAAGLALVSPAGRVLFLKRSGAKKFNGGMWCLPGGKAERGETPVHAALRETEEETGWTAGPDDKPQRAGAVQYYEVTYIVFRLNVAEEFVADLSDGEHTEYAWASPDDPPQPLHPGLGEVLPQLAADEDFRASRDKMANAARDLIERKVAAQDAKGESEHRIVIEFNGDFAMGEFIRTLQALGSWGASRNVDISVEDVGTRQELEGKGFRTKFGWDGDGADKIVSAELDGQDLLAMDADFDESKHPRDHGKFSSTSGGSGEEPTPKAKKQQAIDPAKMKKVGSQMGSNPGGVYEDADGTRFYVKKGKSPEHVKNELAAADLYALAGSPTLEYTPTTSGDYIATKMSKLDKPRADQFSPDEKKKAQEDFATHAWLANWDAAGLDFDNVGTVSGKPTALDLGGAMLYRGMGAPKGDKFSAQAGEWDSMRNSQVNPQNAKLFGGMSPEALKKSASKVTKIPDDAIRSVVQKRGLPAAVADKLISRKNDIAKRAGLGSV